MKIQKWTYLIILDLITKISGFNIIIRAYFSQNCKKQAELNIIDDEIWIKKSLLISFQIIHSLSFFYCMELEKFI